MPTDWPTGGVPAHHRWKKMYSLGCGGQGTPGPPVQVLAIPPYFFWFWNVPVKHLRETCRLPIGIPNGGANRPYRPHKKKPRQQGVLSGLWGGW